VEDVPSEFGVMIATSADRFEFARAAPQVAMERKLPYDIWLALAKATPAPLDPEAELAQSLLVNANEKMS
jgi:hypothetical protein